jgi:hypothetical protein
MECVQPARFEAMLVVRGMPLAGGLLIELATGVLGVVVDVVPVTYLSGTFPLSSAKGAS